MMELVKLHTLKIHHLFDNEISKLVNSDLIEKEIEETYNEKILQIKDNDPLKKKKNKKLYNKYRKKIKKLIKRKQ